MMFATNEPCSISSREILESYRNVSRKAQRLAEEFEWIDDQSVYFAAHERYDALEALRAALRQAWVAFFR